MIAIIPARGGSQRIPRKNVKEFFGKPIIAYSIEAAQKSGLFDEVIVSTDDVEIFEIASEHGATSYIRPSYLGDNDVGTQEIARDVLRYIENAPKYACVIYATSPLLCVEDLRRGLKLLKPNRSLSYAYSTDLKGNDAGNFYWGRTQSFLDRGPLLDNSIHVPISPDRVCDINTLEDWEQAEIMYESLRRDNGHKASMVG